MGVVGSVVPEGIEHREAVCHIILVVCGSVGQALNPPQGDGTAGGTIYEQGIRGVRKKGVVADIWDVSAGQHHLEGVVGRYRRRDFNAVGRVNSGARNRRIGYIVIGSMNRDLEFC